MRRVIYLLLLSAVVVSRAQVVVNDTLAVVEHDTLAVPWPRCLAEHIDTMLQAPMFDSSVVGIEIYDLTADSVIYAYNNRQRLRPASTMKMVIAVAALDRLGGDYRLKTRLYHTGEVRDSTLYGDLYCRGGMDPLFDNDDMNAFVRSLCEAGIDTIRGNIYADLSMKDTLMMGEGWCWDDDNPRLTPLLICGKDRFISRFVERLRAVGIIFEGDTLRAVTPEPSRELCCRTHTIDRLLRRMMKKSDNLFAEALFYNLAVRQGGRGASARQGRQAVNRLITLLGFDADDYYVADGSGLSLYNYLSPRLEVAFLRYAYNNRSIYTRLLPSLPIAGDDGTLATRMRGTAAQYNVRAKTGTVTGISALAGYCTAPNGHRLCFSIMNAGIPRAAIGRTFQDRLCVAMCTM